jgi:hypothetical protein
MPYVARTKSNHSHPKHYWAGRDWSPDPDQAKKYNTTIILPESTWEWIDLERDGFILEVDRAVRRAKANIHKEPQP